MSTNAPRSLRNGLLGYWPVVRSPDGYVRDYSPEENHGVFGFDARWIWFTNPRAVRHVGTADKTYVGYLGGRTGQDIVIASYDHGTGTLEKNAIDERFSDDDHTNPSLLVRGDGHVLVFWAGHNGDALFYRISSAPEDVTAFESVQTIEQEVVTYPNPVSVEKDGEEVVYLFYRDRTFTTDTTKSKYGYAGDGHIYYRSSTDGGETWGEQRRLVTAPLGHYSMYFVPVAADDGTIHLFFTDAERGGDAPKWDVMHCCFRDGTIYRADGSELAQEGDLPLAKADLEVVYDSSAPGNHAAWIWDVGVDDEGHPVAVYATFESTLAHRYRYVRWDGNRWLDNHVTDAGRYIAERPIELHYSAGVAMDSSNPDVLYAAIATASGGRIERLETDTDGRTWATRTVTRRAVGRHIRPVVPQNSSAEVPVLWLAGSYKHMDTSQTVLRGLPTDSIDEPTLRGDGEHGVSLGLDLYPERTFRDGISLSGVVMTEDVTARQTIADLGSAIRLSIANETEEGIEFALADEDEQTSACWDGIRPDETYVVEGKWDGSDLTLLVDGAVVDETAFDGPIRMSENRGWTLMQDEYLMENGLVGELRGVRLYNRALSKAESQALASLASEDDPVVR